MMQVRQVNCKVYLITFAGMQPLVSIIMPMYRVATVLPSCIGALKRQTYKHLELLFVDDCSPDDSATIVEQAQGELEAMGMRVRLIRHEHNQGVAAARSTALGEASGDYVYHYDADDMLEDDAIEVLVTEAVATDADIVGCEWLLCHEANKRRMHQALVSTGTEAFASMCKGVLKWNLWLFLVRRSLIEHPTPLRFTHGQNMGEDMMLMGKCFLRAHRVSIVDRALYHYVKNDAEGQLTARYTPEHWAQVDANMRELERSVLASGLPNAPRLLAQLKLTLKLPLLISPLKEDYQRWAGWFAEANDYAMLNERLPLRTRLLQWAAAHGQWWAVRLYYELIMKRLYALLYK